MPVIELKTKRDIEADDIAEHLADLIEQHKRGELTAIAVAYVRPDHNLGGTWSGSSLAGPLIAAVGLLQHRLLNSLDDDE